MTENLTELEIAKKTLFDRDALHVGDVKLFPGNSRDIAPEQMAEQVNNVVAQLLSGDFEDVTELEDA